MAEIYLVRAAETYVGWDSPDRNSEAWHRNKDRCWQVGLKVSAKLKGAFGIDPVVDRRSVLSSTFFSSVFTVQAAGFNLDEVEVSELLDEPRPLRRKTYADAEKKYLRSGVLPQEVVEHGQALLTIIDYGTYDFSIYVAGGLFLAAVLQEWYARQDLLPPPMDPRSKQKGELPAVGAVIRAPI